MVIQYLDLLLDDQPPDGGSSSGPWRRGWLARRGAADDPELFIERVQYVETRDYVRRILRNLAVYRVLYPALQ